LYIEGTSNRISWKERLERIPRQIPKYQPEEKISLGRFEVM
jgi:hypothetical protein